MSSNRPRTDRQLVSALGFEDLDAREIYLALGSLANNGIHRDEEKTLGPTERMLLQARRDLNAGRMDLAERNLTSLKLDPETDPAHSLFAGDREALLGVVLQRKGDLVAAARASAAAVAHFKKAGDHHRALRTRINAEICKGDIQNFASGALFSLGQEAMRENYPDLVGNLHKAYAVELMNRGEFAGALAEILVAVKNYEMDGCAEDIAVARCLAAILLFLTGDIAGARLSLSLVHTQGGKIQTYFKAARDLMAGMTPSIPKAHPLDGTPWPIQRIKGSSITGKILARLHLGPATRDELIREVWGENAIDPSYSNRFFNAINQLRKKQGHAIVFDGGAYRLN